MKKFLTILILSSLSLYAQPYQINYSVIIENCDKTDHLEIMSGTMTEGEGFTFKPFTLPIDYFAAQFLYNIFVDGQFFIPAGSLSENISLKINMSNFWCNPGVLEEPTGVMRLLSLSVEITGEKTGHHPNDYYWFNENKEAQIKLVLSKISYFLNLLKVNDPNVLEIFFVNNNSVDKGAVRKEITNNDFIIYPKHFSLLSAGIISGTTDVRDITSSSPLKFNLTQNYPNPFNPLTKIRFSLPESNFTSLTVYNILGKQVATLINNFKKAGEYEAEFDASNLPSGLYLYTIVSGKFKQTNKMVLLK